VTGGVQIFLGSKENCVSMRSIGVGYQTIPNSMAVKSIYCRIHSDVAF
jgi:hypothetical protein